MLNNMHHRLQNSRFRVTDSIRQIEFFETPHGVSVTAGCDVGYQAHERRNTPNQDRVVVDPKRERFVVIDGIGGSEEGEKAASLGRIIHSTKL